MPKNLKDKTVAHYKPASWDKPSGAKKKHFTKKKPTKPNLDKAAQQAITQNPCAEVLICDSVPSTKNSIQDASKWLASFGVGDGEALDLDGTLSEIAELKLKMTASGASLLTKQVQFKEKIQQFKVLKSKFPKVLEASSLGVLAQAQALNMIHDGAVLSMPTGMSKSNLGVTMMAMQAEGRYWRFTPTPWKGFRYPKVRSPQVTDFLNVPQPDTYIEVLLDPEIRPRAEYQVARTLRNIHQYIERFEKENPTAGVPKEEGVLVSLILGAVNSAEDQLRGEHRAHMQTVQHIHNMEMDKLRQELHEAESKLGRIPTMAPPAEGRAFMDDHA